MQYERGRSLTIQMNNQCIEIFWATYTAQMCIVAYGHFFLNIVNIVKYLILDSNYTNDMSYTVDHAVIIGLCCAGLSIRADDR